MAGLTSHDAQTVRAAYLMMDWGGWFVLIPFSLASLLTGIVQSLGTTWGLSRHYWVIFKLLINTSSPPPSCCCTRRPSGFWQIKRRGRHRMSSTC